MLFHYFAHFIRRKIAPTALPVSKCPSGCNVASSDQLAKLTDNLLIRVSLNQVNFIVLILRKDHQLIGIRVAHIKGNLSRNIHKHSEGIVCAISRHNKVVRTVK